jgi:hypothetical protein
MVTSYFWMVFMGSSSEPVEWVIQFTRSTGVLEAAILIANELGDDIIGLKMGPFEKRPDILIENHIIRA